MLENAKRWVNPINTSNKAKKIRRSMMAGLATFAVAILLFAQIVLSADEAKNASAGITLCQISCIN